MPKTYFAKVSGCVTEEDVNEFSKGVVLDDGYETKPGFLNILHSGEISEIELTITEGKFHQVKRMFESVGKSSLSQTADDGALKVRRQFEVRGIPGADRSGAAGIAEIG